MHENFFFHYFVFLPLFVLYLLSGWEEVIYDLLNMPCIY